MASSSHHRVIGEIPLDGGNVGGAVRVGDTVRRTTGPWTPAVHELLAHLESRGFAGAPRPRGLDDQGREILSFLPGETVGSQKPWPAWAFADQSLIETAEWLKGYHRAVEDFIPSPAAQWREDGVWESGLIIGHNDAAPYNAAWDGRVLGFFDWDFAGPVTKEWDIAYSAFSWVPLHCRRAVIDVGFTAFADRGRRLRLFLDSYGWEGSAEDMMEHVRARTLASIRSIRTLAANKDPVFVALQAAGHQTNLEDAVAEFPEIDLRSP